MIREMSREECLQVLARARLARLACAHDNQPYVVPVSVAYDAASECLYGFTTVGQKVEWMRANPQVCIEVDEITAHNQWVSVIAFGRYEELPETPERDGERKRAWQALKTHHEWWEPGCTAWAARVHSEPAGPPIPVFYRVRINNITGHEATRARDALESAASIPRAERLGWLRTALSRVFGRKSKQAGSDS